jgi:hypothetical protein
MRGVLKERVWEQIKHEPSIVRSGEEDREERIVHGFSLTGFNLVSVAGFQQICSALPPTRKHNGTCPENKVHKSKCSLSKSHCSPRL